MKKTKLYISLIAILLSATAIQAQNDCDVRALKNELLQGLKPDFKYDSFKATRFTYKNEVQVFEIAAPLFKDEKFRFLLNTAGLPKDIEIKFFDKKNTDRMEDAKILIAQSFEETVQKHQENKLKI